MAIVIFCSAGLHSPFVIFGLKKKRRNSVYKAKHIAEKIVVKRWRAVT